jgi:hypothetical protein
MSTKQLSNFFPPRHCGGPWPHGHASPAALHRGGLSNWFLEHQLMATPALVDVAVADAASGIMEPHHTRDNCRPQLFRQVSSCKRMQTRRILIAVTQLWPFASSRHSKNQVLNKVIGSITTPNMPYSVSNLSFCKNKLIYAPLRLPAKAAVLGITRAKPSQKTS